MQKAVESYFAVCCVMVIELMEMCDFFPGGSSDIWMLAFALNENKNSEYWIFC